MKKNMRRQLLECFLGALLMVVMMPPSFAAAQESKDKKQGQEKQKVKISTINRQLDSYVKEMKFQKIDVDKDRLRLIVKAILEDKGYVLYDP